MLDVLWANNIQITGIEMIPDGLHALRNVTHQITRPNRFMFVISHFLKTGNVIHHLKHDKQDNLVMVVLHVSPLFLTVIIQVFRRHFV